MNKPSVSIIVPVYNVEPYVEDCIRSVMRQTYDGSMECIVVDDCGTDNSMDIVEKLVAEYDGPISFKILHHEHNRGLSVARNTGFDAAIGEWVWFVDSDDWIEDGALKELYTLLRENEDNDVICIQKNNYLKEKTTFMSVNNNLESPILMSGKQYLNSNLQKSVVAKFVVRRDFLINNKILFYPGILHEDILYVQILMYLAPKVFVSNQPLYGKRQRRAGSIVNSIGPKNANDMIIIHQKQMEFFSTIVDDKDKEWFFKQSFSSIISAYKKIDRFYKTDAYLDFQDNNKKYIDSICKKALHYDGVGFKMVSLVIRFCPHRLNYYNKICSIIKKSLSVLK